MVLVLLCFIVPIILIEIIGVIYDYVTKVKPYKKSLANLKVGNVYFLWLNTWEDNPFAVPRYLKATIKEIRYNNKGMPYVIHIRRSCASFKISSHKACIFKHKFVTGSKAFFFGGFRSYLNLFK